MVLGWFVVTALLSAHAVRQATAAGHTTLIIEFNADSVSTALAATINSVSAANAASKSSAAYSAAVERGVPAARAAAVAAVAQSAASLQPAVSALTSLVTSAAAEKTGVKFVQRSVYTSVLQGTALSVSSRADALRLKQELETNQLIQSVYIAGVRKKPKPPGSNSKPLTSSSSSAAAAAAAAGTGTEEAADTSASAATAIAEAAAATELTRANSAVKGSANATKLAAVPGYLSTTDGQGVLLCILDSGIQYTAAVYGNCTAVNRPLGECKVVTGYDFVGDKYTASFDGSSPAPDKIPLDCQGHGSAVASTAASSFGVAPGARLGAYRIFGCDGDTTDDIIIAAIDMAVRDGCDIINLSLAGTSGYPDNGLYRKVMANAAAKGVLATRAVGNMGDDGAFAADAFTAAGAVLVAAAGNCQSNLDVKVVSAPFSSYGPSPDMSGLVPHVSAPGACVPVMRMAARQSSLESGTSVAAPFVAGCLALWLQRKQQQAAALGQPLNPQLVSQEAASKALVITATPIVDEDNPRFLEPVAHAGSGLIRVDALLGNQLSAEPMFLPLPSAPTSSFTTTITYTWQGPAHSSETVGYNVLHMPAAAISIADGWYLDLSMERVYTSAQVSVNPSKVVINTRTKRPVTLQVTFTLPPGLAGRGLLYSGLIRLMPALARYKVTPVSVPYQGYSQPWSSLPLLARNLDTADLYHSQQLQQRANALCYTPTVESSATIFDLESGVPFVCDAFAASDSDVISVSARVLRTAPACTLRLTLAPQVPIRRLSVDLLGSGSDSKIGSLLPIDTSASDNCLTPPYIVGSYCLNFNGSYTSPGGLQQQVKVGSTYRLQARVTGPVAMADRALGAQEDIVTVNIRGQFRVVR